MRKKVIAGSFVLICGVFALWCLLLLSDSRKKLRIGLTFVGTTNSDGQQFALFRFNNSGKKTIVWEHAFMPWESRAETEQGWKRTPGKDHEIWSEMFTNFVEAKALTCFPLAGR